VVAPQEGNIMSTRITRALVCDGCAAEFETTDGPGDELAIARAEAGWRQFTLQLRNPWGTMDKPTVHVCPACSPRAVADRIRAEHAAKVAEQEARRQAEEEAELAQWRRDHETAQEQPADGGEGASPPIEELGLTVRAYNGLKREGIHNLSELTAHTEQDLLWIRNFGAGCLAQVRDKLAARGLALKGDKAPAEPETSEPPAIPLEEYVFDGYNEKPAS
jgi:hypothetical protein